MYKLIPKPARLKFNREIDAILAAYTADPTDKENWRHRRIAMTVAGPLTMTPDPLEHGDRIAGVSARFLDTHHPRFNIAVAMGAAPISGKCNPLSADPDQVLTMFRSLLDQVQARPFTAEELTNWPAEWERILAVSHQKWKELHGHPGPRPLPKSPTV